MPSKPSLRRRVLAHVVGPLGTVALLTGIGGFMSVAALGGLLSSPLWFPGLVARGWARNQTDPLPSRERFE